MSHAKKESNASAKSIGPGQPAQCAQADLGRNSFFFFAIFNLSAFQRIILAQHLANCLTKSIDIGS